MTKSMCLAAFFVICFLGCGGTIGERMPAGLQPSNAACMPDYQWQSGRWLTWDACRNKVSAEYHRCRNACLECDDRSWTAWCRSVCHDEGMDNFSEECGDFPGATVSE